MLKVDWIRHTSLNISGATCYGQTDVPVADTFEEEAAVVRSSIEGRSYDAVFTSPLSRALMLARACGYGECLQLEPRVMERNFGDWELQPWEYIDELTAHQPHLIDELGHAMPPNGETLNDLLTRVAHFIDELRREQYRRVAVFCHGGVINSARYLKDLITHDQIFIDVPLYGSINTLNYALSDGGRVVAL